MLYRVVLIFPDTEHLSEFIARMELPGEANGRDCTFVGTLDESQIRVARLQFGAYVRVVRVLR